MTTNGTQPPSTLTPVQAQVVLALAQGVTITAAAAAAGLHRSTVHIWLQTQPEFQEAVQQARAEFSLTVRDDLRELSLVALATLRSLLQSAETPPAARARLALAILLHPLVLAPERNLTAPAAAVQATPVRQNSTHFDTSDTPTNPSGSLPDPGPQPGRNDPCPCGSGSKFKHCCLGKPATLAMLLSLNGKSPGASDNNNQKQRSY